MAAEDSHGPQVSIGRLFFQRTAARGHLAGSLSAVTPSGAIESVMRARSYLYAQRTCCLSRIGKERYQYHVVSPVGLPLLRPGCMRDTIFCNVVNIHVAPPVQRIPSRVVIHKIKYEKGSSGEVSRNAALGRETKIVNPWVK